MANALIPNSCHSLIFELTILIGHLYISGIDSISSGVSELSVTKTGKTKSS